MKIEHSFRNMGREMGLKVEMFEGHIVAISTMWRKALSTKSRFCKALVACDYLSERQMQRASRRYRLGCTRNGGVIFWQIDQEDRVHDGKVMYYRPDCHRDHDRHPTWVSTLLTCRFRWTDAGSLTTSHCLFGQHLLSEKGEKLAVAIVESEKTAVIMSELIPQFLWLATGGMGNVQPDKFRPLRGHKVILFPDTDPDGTAYRKWYEAAQLVMHQPFWEDSPPIRVSPYLELHATPQQKAAKIDLADYWAICATLMKNEGATLMNNEK